MTLRATWFRTPSSALALEHGCEVVTFDRDFARFTSVTHRRLPTG